MGDGADLYPVLTCARRACNVYAMTNTAHTDQHATAMSLHSNHDYGMVCTRTGDDGFPVTRSYLTKTWHIGGQHDLSDAGLDYDERQRHISRGPARAAGYLRTVPTVEARRQIVGDAHRRMNMTPGYIYSTAVAEEVRQYHRRAARNALDA